MAWRVGQAGRSLDAADLSYRLRSLPMAGAVLHVGAHPDDEDSGLLACLAHGLCVRCVYWSATRGEAGQNRLNSYRGEALGVFRTWESEDARAIDGAEALFGPFYDFGYSKSGSDTVSKWARDDVVREIARAIQEGSRAYLKLRTVDARTDRKVWADVFDCELSELVAVSTQAADAMTAAIVAEMQSARQ